MTTRSITLLGAFALIALTSTQASAQGPVIPTPEKTVITNTATVTYKDAAAAANSYTATGSVSITVGFKGSFTVSGSATVNPLAPSTGNTATFTITNGGNGTDTVTIATTLGSATNVSITGYRIGTSPTVYADLTALNAQLRTDTLKYNSTLDIHVVYDVLAGLLGSSTTLQLTATSARTGGSSNSFTSTIQPPGVEVNAVTATENRFPGTGYTTTFTVKNVGSVAATYNLTATSGSANATNVSVAATVSVAAGATETVTVTYDVPTAANPTGTAVITLTATDAALASSTDNATHTVTVTRPEITVRKTAHVAVDGAAITGTVPPGGTVAYKIEVENTGNELANTISITDALNAQLTFVSASDDGSAGWTITPNNATPALVTSVSATLAGNLAATAKRHFWIVVTVK